MSDAVVVVAAIFNVFVDRMVHAVNISMITPAGPREHNDNAYILSTQ